VTHICQKTAFGPIGGLRRFAGQGDVFHHVDGGDLDLLETLPVTGKVSLTHLGFPQLLSQLFPKLLLGIGLLYKTEDHLIDSGKLLHHEFGSNLGCSSRDADFVPKNRIFLQNFQHFLSSQI